MKSMIFSYIGSKLPHERSQFELELLLPWFKIHGKGILRQANDDVLIDVLKNCILKFYAQNELIIMQGDFGDKFFVVVSGEVHVYVNDSMDPFFEKIVGKSTIIDKDALNVLGNCVAVEDAGYSFGEYALLDEKSVRKASVIAATETMLLVISRESYNESLKNLQQNIIREREHFINTHSLFSDWNPRIKNLLLMSLKKLSISYPFNLVTQGDQWKGLYFVVKGSGKLTIDPDKHETCFPQMFPLDFDLYNKRYQEFPELKPPIFVADLTEAEAVETLMSKRIRLKRAGNYAALEAYVVNKKSFLCSIQPGEIVGDMEFLFGLTSNLYTIIVIEEIEAFHLDLTNLDRILKRLNADNVKSKIARVIKSKMDYREKYFREIPIPLMLFLKLKLYDSKLEIIRPLPKLKTSKKLPSDYLEWQHLLKMYMKNKASLCKPFVKGGIFLKDLMNKNATLRRLPIGENSERPKDIQMSTSDNISYNNFPVAQSRIYQLQNLASDPMQLLEMLYAEIYHPKLLHKPKTDKKSFTEINRKSPTILIDNYPTIISNSNSNSTGNHHETPSDNQRKPNKNFITSSEYFTLLQKSEIEFLNSLCSENSQYEIKGNNLKKVIKENRKVHFLPSLQPLNDSQKYPIPNKDIQVLIKKHQFPISKANSVSINRIP